MTNDLYTLDEDIANNNFIDCVQNAEADLNTDLPLQEVSSLFLRRVVWLYPFC